MVSELKPITEIASKLQIPATALEPYGFYKAKLTAEYLRGLQGRGRGQLILVTAINPTPAGEGKTTTSIGLADALTKLGHQAAVALREPSLGPCFGAKGGATGGGRAMLEPSADINLHFNGDFHAITAAHNLLAALIDNSLHYGNPLNLDARRIEWKRVLDVNDRALRDIVIGLGGHQNGVPREAGFDITAASEIMAIMGMATDLDDLRARLGRIVIGWTREGVPVLAEKLEGVGAMLALLKDALRPNLVQTREGTPAFVHGGPFANIAHGCSTIISTKAALNLADYVVTEAGFGADLGGEKFMHLKARAAGLHPAAVVIVATVRALKYNGGAKLADLSVEDVPALERGIPNLLRHVDNMQNFGMPVVVAINRFASDTDAEMNTVQLWCKRNHVPCIATTHFADGAAGALDLAREVVRQATPAQPPRYLYEPEMPLFDKIRRIAQRIYYADDIDISDLAIKQAEQFAKAGYGQLPVCIAKTQYSFSADASLLGAPRGHRPLVRSLRLSAGAGFIVALLGDIVQMPGLPKIPASTKIDVDAAGQVVGL